MNSLFGVSSLLHCSQVVSCIEEEDVQWMVHLMDIVDTDGLHHVTIACAVLDAIRCDKMTKTKKAIPFNKKDACKIIESEVAGE